MSVAATSFDRGPLPYGNVFKVSQARFVIISTHGRGYYVGMAPWAWFSFECLKTLMKRCLYLPARIYS